CLRARTSPRRAVSRDRCASLPAPRFERASIDRMPSSGVCRYEYTDAGSRLRLSGAWRLSALGDLFDSLQGCIPRSGIVAPVVVDGSGLESIARTGALALWQRLVSAGADPDDVRLSGFANAHRATVELVRERLDEVLGSRAAGGIA